MVPLLLRGGIEEDDLGDIQGFSVGHQSLDDNDPDLSLSKISFWKDDICSHINSVTLFLSWWNLVQRRGEFVC